jgi:polysaccharide export outer membrane protein
VEFVRTPWRWLVLALALGGCTVSAGDETGGTPAEGAASGDGLRPGERVAVTVDGHPDLSGAFELDADGRIVLPLVGGVDAYANTADELADQLVARLADGYLRDPRVDVARLQARPFFILGDVLRPGSYPYRPGMTVADAVAAAGGRLADGGLAVVVTPAGRERDARRAALDTELSPGDVVALEATRG